jgi:tRNA dimethylallyltransferase
MAERSSHDTDPLCWALVGPTASGKTAVSLALAERYPLEIVSVDSMQVYRGMDVGTGKPTPQQMAAVRHHMIDVLEPSRGCNVGRFCRMACRAIEDIIARGRRPLLVGGTPLYLKGLIWGLTDAPGCVPAVRSQLEREAAQLGPEALHRRLAQVDPQAARRIHPNDVQRLVRALEVRELTGMPISGRQEQFDGPPRLPHVMVGLRWPRAQLYERIEQRVDRMMEEGLLDEVKQLRRKLGLQARQALGYGELMEYLDGRCTMAQAVALIKRNTRRFAKHQLTWFRHFPQVRWVDAGAFADARELAERCAILLREHP